MYDDGASDGVPSIRHSRPHDNRVGTQITGAQGLHEPTPDQGRLRLSVGRVIPGTRYRILKWLGEGGMGVVYLAEHIDIERKVAMKILRFDLSQQKRMAQVFRDEARAATRIGSPHIVEIYDFGELQDGRLFFCMELLQGGDLVLESDEAWIEPPRLIGILRQLCKGLQSAHEAGIVHRDIKPENVIVVNKDGRSDFVKIVDFGISTMLAAGSAAGAGIAGTPQYMAPEQAMGESFDGRLDIYALGCMAFELLTGRTPFVGESIEVLLQQQVYEEPPTIESIRPDRDIPASLRAVVMKCLAKRPEDRFESMADLEAALCEAQIQAKLTTPWDDLPVPTAIDPGRRERIIRDMPSATADLDAVRRRPWLWVTIGGGVVGLAAVAAGVWLFLRPPSDDARAEVDRIAGEAMSAAARTYYVYPPIEDPKTPTAYRKVLELEGLEGDADRLGDERGLTLRSEFADTLVTLGDRWWENEGSRRFAREFYVQALVFDDRNARALERAGATPGMILDLRAAAASGEFSDAMLANAQWLNTLAESDEAKMRARLEQELLARFESERAMDELSILGDSQMLEVARGMGIKVGKRPDSDATGATGAAGGAATGGVDEAVPGDEEPGLGATAESMGDGAQGGEVVVDEAGTDTAADGANGGSEAAATGGASSGGAKSSSKSGAKRSEKLGGATRDPDRARELAKEGHAALSAGRRKDAESLFNQAIGYDPRCAEALIGLSDVYFDTGSDNKAVLYAEKAVGVASNNAGYRINLGDAYFKVLRYRDALEQYEKARDLGSSKAQSRIDRVKAKLGG